MSDLVSTEYRGRCQIWYVLNTGGVSDLVYIACRGGVRSGVY